jgi:hypothetical protein
MSTSEKKRRPLRKLISFAVLAGIVIAVKNALKDKGGSYEAPAATQPSAAPVPTPPVPNPNLMTAEDIVERRQVENLDEFADPVEPEAGETPAPESAAEDEPPTRVEPALPLDEAPKSDDPREVPGKIDPFGNR